MAPRPRLLDVAIAAVSAVLTIAVLTGSGEYAASDATIAGSTWWVAPVMLVPSVALLWRRTDPLVAVLGVWVPTAAHALLTGQAAQGLFLVWPAWVSLYALAVYGTRRRLAAGLLVAIAALVLHGLNDPESWSAESGWAGLWWSLVLFVAPLVGGLVAGARRSRVLAVEKELAEARARAAVGEERTRIARELHDVVTHHVNLVVLQAMAASGLLDRDPERVREPLAVIERSGREALEEMRRLLGVLREQEGERPMAPQPGLDDLDRLVAGARATGADVELAVSGDRRPVPAGLSLAAYRIVQEALTNAIRHAPGAAVRVELRFDQDALDVSVRDGGGSGAALHATEGGRGLLGMRERVAVYGGSLEAGLSGPGFAVHARLPVPQAEQPALEQQP